MELSPEAQSIYELLKAETTEEYEARFLDYKKKTLDAVRKFVADTGKGIRTVSAAVEDVRSSTTKDNLCPEASSLAPAAPTKAPAAATAPEAVDVNEQGAASIPSPTHPTSAAAATASTRIPAAAPLDSTSDSVPSSSTATAPTTSAGSHHVLGLTCQTTEDDFSPEAWRLYDLLGRSASQASATPELSSVFHLPSEIKDVCDAVEIDAAALVVSAPTTCLAECPSRDASVSLSVLTPLAAPMSTSDGVLELAEYTEKCSFFSPHGSDDVPSSPPLAMTAAAGITLNYVQTTEAHLLMTDVLPTNLVCGVLLPPVKPLFLATEVVHAVTPVVFDPGTATPTSAYTSSELAVSVQNNGNNNGFSSQKPIACSMLVRDLDADNTRVTAVAHLNKGILMAVSAPTEDTTCNMLFRCLFRECRPLPWPSFEFNQVWIQFWYESVCEKISGFTSKVMGITSGDNTRFGDDKGWSELYAIDGYHTVKPTVCCMPIVTPIERDLESDCKTLLRFFPNILDDALVGIVPFPMLESVVKLAMSLRKFEGAVHVKFLGPLHQAQVYWSHSKMDMFGPAGKTSLYGYNAAQFQWEIAWPTTTQKHSIPYGMHLYLTLECSTVICSMEVAAGMRPVCVQLEQLTMAKLANMMYMIAHAVTLHRHFPSGKLTVINTAGPNGALVQYLHCKEPRTSVIPIFLWFQFATQSSFGSQNEFHSSIASGKLHDLVEMAELTSWPSFELFLCDSNETRCLRGAFHIFTSLGSILKDIYSSSSHYLGMEQIFWWLHFTVQSSLGSRSTNYTEYFEWQIPWYNCPCHAISRSNRLLVGIKVEAQTHYYSQFISTFMDRIPISHNYYINLVQIHLEHIYIIIYRYYHDPALQLPWDPGDRPAFAWCQDNSGRVDEGCSWPHIDTQVPWDPGGDRLGVKPNFMEGGLSTTCLLLVAGVDWWAATLGPGLLKNQTQRTEASIYVRARQKGKIGLERKDWPRPGRRGWRSV